MGLGLTAELVCSGFARSLRFWTDVLGFAALRYDPEARAAELERDGALIILHEAREAPTGPLDYPCGRGVTLTVWVDDVEAVYAGVHAYGARLHTPLADYRRDDEPGSPGHTAFVVMDPDGYAVKFAQAIGRQG
jgi:catechol 2,3-dioxygenase-like lactoylglutathione lyase family enzyme